MSPLVEHAIEVAASWHDGTYRKSRWRSAPFVYPGDEPVRVPVMVHLAAVASMLQRAGWDEVTVAAGYLHDVLEDENRFGACMDYEALRAEIGADVADLVRIVSEVKLDESGQWKPWKRRKTEYLAQLAAGTDASLAISLADKLHNLWSMNQALVHGIDIFTSTPTRRALSKGPELQRWFFEAVLEVSEGFTDPRLVPMREAVQEEVRQFGQITPANKRA